MPERTEPSCKVKPYKLKERGFLDSAKDQDKQVMQEDRLRDVKFVDLSPTHIDSVEVQNYWVGDLDNKEDLENDLVGAKYLKMDNSFQDFFIFILKLPVSDHKYPKVLEAKLKEVKNLEDNEVFEKIVDDGQETIGSQWVIT